MSDITLTPEIQLEEIRYKNEENKSNTEGEDSPITIEAKEENNKYQEKNENINLGENKLINDDVEKGIESDYVGKEYMVYQYFEGDQNQAKLPTTWVQFTGNQSRLPPLEGVPLDYDPYIRNSFVRLVFSIVLAMLLVTGMFTTIVYITPEIRQIFVIHGFMIVIPGMVIVVGLSYAMACSACTRQPPCNIICLVLAVIGMSLICAFLTVRYDTRIVLYALMATVAVVITCILLACSNFDFTKYILYVIVVSVAFFTLATMVSLTMLLTGTRMPMLRLVILIVGTLINVVVLTVELQTILGGKAVEISEDDYAFAAFLLYTSIVDIFLKVLQIMGFLDDM